MFVPNWRTFSSIVVEFFWGETCLLCNHFDQMELSTILILMLFFRFIGFFVDLGAPWFGWVRWTTACPYKMDDRPVLLVKYIFQIEHHWPWYQLAIVQFVSCSLRWYSRDFCYLKIELVPVSRGVYIYPFTTTQLSSNADGPRLAGNKIANEPVFGEDEKDDVLRLSDTKNLTCGPGRVSAKRTVENEKKN